jgi:hypothetical protein
VTKLVHKSLKRPEKSLFFSGRMAFPSEFDPLAAPTQPARSEDPMALSRVRLPSLIPFMIKDAVAFPAKALQ